MSISYTLWKVLRWRRQSLCRCHILFEQMSQWLWVYHLTEQQSVHRQQEFIRLGLWSHNKAVVISSIKHNQHHCKKRQPYTGFIIHQDTIFNFPHFTDEETEVWEANEFCPRSKVVQLEFYLVWLQNMCSVSNSYSTFTVNRVWEKNSILTLILSIHK